MTSGPVELRRCALARRCSCCTCTTRRAAHQYPAASMNLPEVALTDVPEAPAFALTEDVYGRANSFLRELDWETILWKATVRGYREIQAGPPRTSPTTTLSGMSAAWILRQPGVDMIVDNWSSDNAGLAAIRQEFNSTRQSRANAARRIYAFTTHFIFPNKRAKSEIHLLPPRFFQKK